MMESKKKAFSLYDIVMIGLSASECEWTGTW